MRLWNGRHKTESTCSITAPRSALTHSFPQTVFLPFVAYHPARSLVRNRHIYLIQTDFLYEFTIWHFYQIDNIISSRGVENRIDSIKFSRRERACKSWMVWHSITICDATIAPANHLRWSATLSLISKFASVADHRFLSKWCSLKMFLFSHFNLKTHSYFGVVRVVVSRRLSGDVIRPTRIEWLLTPLVYRYRTSPCRYIYLNLDVFCFLLFLLSTIFTGITRFCYSPHRVCGRWANAVQTISNTIHWLMKRHSIGSKQKLQIKFFIEFIRRCSSHICACRFRSIYLAHACVQWRLSDCHYSTYANCSSGRRDESNNV